MSILRPWPPCSGSGASIPSGVVLFQTGVGTRALFQATDAAGSTGEVLRLLQGSIVAVRGPKPVGELNLRGVRIDIRAASPFTTDTVLEALADIPLRAGRFWCSAMARRIESCATRCRLAERRSGNCDVPMGHARGYGASARAARRAGPVAVDAVVIHQRRANPSSVCGGRTIGARPGSGASIEPADRRLDRPRLFERIARARRRAVLRRRARPSWGR